MRYALDPELLAVAEEMGALPADTVEAVRAGETIMLDSLPPFETPDSLTIRDVSVPGPSGAPDVPVRIYTPRGSTGTRPALIYIHGGGFISGSIGSYEPDAADTAASLDVVVVSVEYRLAPEHPFPAAPDDCYAALLWTAGHAVELGIDPARIGVGGASAGGTLAAAVALMARDRGGPAICYQHLDIPAFDDHMETHSARTLVDAPLLSSSDLALAWDSYLGKGVPGTVGVSPYAAPARAEDLSGLPPAFIATCEFDPLRDEGLAYAQRLLQAGVPTEIHNYPGTFHGSTMAYEAAVSQRMFEHARDAMRRGLKARPTEQSTSA